MQKKQITFSTDLPQPVDSDTGYMRAIQKKTLEEQQRYTNAREIGKASQLGSIQILSDDQKSGQNAVNLTGWLVLPLAIALFLLIGIPSVISLIVGYPIFSLAMDSPIPLVIDAVLLLVGIVLIRFKVKARADFVCVYAKGIAQVSGRTNASQVIRWEEIEEVRGEAQDIGRDGNVNVQQVLYTIHTSDGRTMELRDYRRLDEIAEIVNEAVVKRLPPEAMRLYTSTRQGS